MWHNENHYRLNDKLVAMPHPRFYLREDLPDLFRPGTRCALEWEALVAGALALAELDEEEFFEGGCAAAALWLHEAALRIGIQVELMQGTAETTEGQAPHVWLTYFCGDKAVIFDPWNEVFGSERGYGSRQGKVVSPEDALMFCELPDFEGADAADFWEVEQSMREVL